MSDEHLHRIDAKLENLTQQLNMLDRKVDRLWMGVDFVRTRLSSYLGDGIALTYLVDETPIFINSNDFGGPINFVNGGRYEEENLEVMLSFVKPDTVFIDIGANLGFFTLMISRRIFRGGHVHAFEPHPKIFELLKRSIFLNGLMGTVDCYNFGLSDREASIEFHYPAGHVGGGFIGDGRDLAGHTVVKSEIKRLDAQFAPGFACDLVKIDVEGHELHVLKGMESIISRSPDIKILFEKLASNAGYEEAAKELFDRRQMALYGVGGNSTLVRLPSLNDFREWSGYVLATRSTHVGDNLYRGRFTIYPAQLNGRTGGRIDSSKKVDAAAGEILFYGPYWFLRRGVWKLKINGHMSGSISITIAERFGHKVVELRADSSDTELSFISDRDLVYFECVARANAGPATISLNNIEFVRIG